MKRKVRVLSAATILVVLLMSTATVVMAAYTVTLISPTVGNSSTTFTWEISGSSTPGAGDEISHIEIHGCWSSSFVASHSAVDKNGTPVSTELKPNGVIKTGDIQDVDLPVTVTIVFTKAVTAFASPSDTIIKLKQGKLGLVNYQVDGPKCDPTALTLMRLNVTSAPSRLPVGAAAALAVLIGSAAVGGVLVRQRGRQL